MRRLLMGLAIVAALGLLPKAAVAEDAQLARLISAKTGLKWNWVPPGKSVRYGHAEALIDAPLPRVRSHVTDFGRYKQFSTKFKAARVVAKQGDATDV
jgi:hypothetical protein